MSLTKAAKLQEIDPPIRFRQHKTDFPFSSPVSTACVQFAYLPKMSTYRITQQYLKYLKVLGTNSIKCSPVSSATFSKTLTEGRPAFRSTHFPRVPLECKSSPLTPPSPAPPPTPAKQLQISSGQHGEAPQGRAPNARPWRVSGNGQHEWKIRKVGKHTRASLGRRVYHVKGVISATLREILGRRRRSGGRV